MGRPVSTRKCKEDGCIAPHWGLGYCLEHYNASPERVSKSYDPLRHRQYGWKRQGIKLTVEEYTEIFNKQNGQCAICGVHHSDLKKVLCVDHCHETNEVRGLLCNDCNRGLGQFKDDVERLEEAVKYLLTGKQRRN